MRKTLIAALLALAAPAAAQTGAECARIAEDTERLACFDALFVSREETQAQGRWTVTTTTSALDDSYRVVLYVDSLETFRDRVGRQAFASLYIRCEEGTTMLFIYWGGHFMSDLNGGGRVDYRVDLQQPQHILMHTSDSRSALGLWHDDRSVPFIMELMAGTELYARATPYLSNRIEVRFPIAGLSEAIQPLREACNW